MGRHHRYKRIALNMVSFGLLAIGLSGCSYMREIQARKEEARRQECMTICTNTFGADMEGYTRCMSNGQDNGHYKPSLCKAYVQPFQNCENYGFSYGTSDFANCVMNESHNEQTVALEKEKIAAMTAPKTTQICTTDAQGKQSCQSVTVG